MQRVADTVSPQSVCAVVGIADVGLEDLLARPATAVDQAVLLVCVDVRDPGNLGAVLRIASATGAAGVICCAGTVDAYNPKVVRSSAGAVFQMPVVTDVGPVETLGAALSGRLPVLGDGAGRRDRLRRRRPAGAAPLGARKRRSRIAGRCHGSARWLPHHPDGAGHGVFERGDDRRGAVFRVGPPTPHACLA